MSGADVIRRAAIPGTAAVAAAAVLSAEPGAAGIAKAGRWRRCYDLRPAGWGHRPSVWLMQKPELLLDDVEAINVAVAAPGLQQGPFSPIRC